MRTSKCVLAALVMLTLLTLLTGGVYAQVLKSETPFEVGQQWITISPKEEDGQITGFAVREDGWVAVAVEWGFSDDSYINVYDSNYGFQHCYIIPTQKIPYVAWSQAGNLYFVNDPGEICYEISPEGIILSIEQMASTSEVSAYVEQVKATQKVVGDRTYISRLRNKLLRPICNFHNEIVCIQDGKETVVYYSHTPEGLKFVLMVLGFPAFLYFCIRHTIRNVKRSEEEKKAAAPPE